VYFAGITKILKKMKYIYYNMTSKRSHDLNHLMDGSIDADDSVWTLLQSLDQDTSTSSQSPSSSPDESICKHCGSCILMLEDGNYVCRDCGTVCDRYIDSHAEWRYYGHEDSKHSDPTRCGLPTNELLPESSLGTIIGNKMGECYEMKLIRKYQMWNSMTYKEPYITYSTH
jgi:hypothetical protein